MNREDIIKLAHQSHLDVYGLGTDYAKFADALKRFAALVAAAEREACAKVVEESSLPDAYSEACLPEIAAAIRAMG